MKLHEDSLLRLCRVYNRLRERLGRDSQMLHLLCNDMLRLAEGQGVSVSHWERKARQFK
jgi:hypothetical protein